MIDTYHTNHLGKALQASWVNRINRFKEWTYCRWCQRDGIPRNGIHKNCIHREGIHIYGIHREGTHRDGIHMYIFNQINWYKQTSENKIHWTTVQYNGKVKKHIIFSF